ncbi:Cytidine and deoxycytidylate deaminase zinc-binding region [Paracoccus aminovorans]|uniref:Cytidine and deoxycytidylate deaminase zinc-binding region n=1 Tax=Paracoccus aminovorans TaxID=34004 RepID=A0A1I3EIX1_9RHOB|nr:nucleoside deaminase [Paracoccus aminovorans]CQR84357.1 dCMP deaminase [Paracoccus aminovorans]SFH98790.1 Cytidine and deoxycytidylate deaminase zinc-binding region [Paracoccus aminovorans]
MNDRKFLDEAVALARGNAAAGGRPFGAVLVKDGTIVARAVNRMVEDSDPTAHAELLALRKAGQALGGPRLDGCAVYASGQPCPMCLAAMRMAGITSIAYAYSNEEAAPFGLSTAKVAAELSRPAQDQDWATIRHLPQTDSARPEPYLIWAERPAGQL